MNVFAIDCDDADDKHPGKTETRAKNSTIHSNLVSFIAYGCHWLHRKIQLLLLLLFANDDDGGGDGGADCRLWRRCCRQSNALQLYVNYTIGAIKTKQTCMHLFQFHKFVGRKFGLVSIHFFDVSPSNFFRSTARNGNIGIHHEWTEDITVLLMAKQRKNENICHNNKMLSRNTRKMAFIGCFWICSIWGFFVSIRACVRKHLTT